MKFVNKFCLIPLTDKEVERKVVVLKSFPGNKLYEEIKCILEIFGYQEKVENIFESIDARCISNILEVITAIEETGFHYSKELEFNVINCVGKISNMNKQKKHDSNQITVYLYLFLRLHFDKKGHPGISLFGNSSIENEDELMNYIKITKLNFTINKENNDTVRLVSNKNQKEILKECSVLFKGGFKYGQESPNNEYGVNTIIKKGFNYRLTQVTKFIDYDQKMEFIINESDIDDLKKHSKIIKSDYTKSHKYLASKKDIEKELKDFIDFNNEKMKEESENENFEKAGEIKRQTHHLKSIKKTISTYPDMIQSSKLTKLLSVNF